MKAAIIRPEDDATYELIIEVAGDGKLILDLSSGDEMGICITITTQELLEALKYIQALPEVN